MATNKATLGDPARDEIQDLVKKARDAQRGSLEVARGKGFAVFHPTPRQRRCVGGVGGVGG
ncbi:hypothetical protein [Pseudomonas oligotrophica]|uniref:hypothetical protein n=1 Tax=Pseudomonas oligotrophica TaxID=2912055 RepID=UPI001F2D8CC8|nr:hypothetical protein [Pseudomonas oligotrophica]MCF7203540.1 hypothetical protein [Pseudomonas oligotrophica]